jgi:hypothetical protein
MIFSMNVYVDIETQHLVNENQSTIEEYKYTGRIHPGKYKYPDFFCFLMVKILNHVMILDDIQSY